ncbi:IS66 family transposase [Leisingera methylohalidivorans]|uniref:Transposase n=1 Tax=Leisingera methylohalidivorans DSM 14336 TaxID=999552 RepID=V9VVK2_9RHOB|nr:transposase [Leisingera methylohalidivorans]AHD00907.1 transposase [Leisingera methylohalidivorans DSM 14336]
MLDAPNTLPSDPGELHETAEGSLDLVKAHALRVAKLERQLAGHNRLRFGSKPESLDQLLLRLEEEETAAAQVAGEDAPDGDAEGQEAKPKRKPPPPPPEMPRIDQILTPGEDCKCGGKLRTIGGDVTEELEYAPGRFVVNRIFRPRMACRDCERTVQSALPSRPIKRDRPGPGLLDHVLVSTYADHCPLYRKSQIYGREGIDLDRCTPADWGGRSAALPAPMADAIGRHVRAGQTIFADDIPNKMRAKGTCTTARIRTYVRVDAKGTKGAELSAPR